MRTLFIVLLAAAVVVTSATTFAQIPDHPRQLSFSPLTFAPPKAKDYRVVLSNGMVVYIAEDHTLPTVDIRATVRTGSLYDPKGKEGLARMAGDVLRTGGTKNISGDELDERLAFLGASIGSGITSTSGSASMSCLARHTDEVLGLFADMLMNPAFAEDKIRLWKDQAIEALKTKNDQPRAVLEREFRKLLYGDHPLVWE
ncbi:MAG: insulinase family protein, partial [candidate division KSB1 bacterium]|nr:insulinase family protein [candidate division KSB1 bacterium]